LLFVLESASPIDFVRLWACTMAAKKRASDDASAGPKAKKAKTAEERKAPKPVTEKAGDAQPPQSSTLLREEVDFPRGGGTTFTPFEVKAIQKEGLEEANKELFQVRSMMLAEWIILI
jgi:rRNA biogenesis protein RRP5